MNIMLKVTNPEKIEDALFEYHSRLVSAIISKIKYTIPIKIVEIGSGSGAFTIPLLKELDNNFEVFYCVDSYTGPYKGDKKTLQSKLTDKDFQNSVEIIEKDVRNLGSTLSNVDLVIGHEVLCDLNPELVEDVMRVCYAVLNRGGFFIHSGFSPFPLNRAEELVKIINDYSEEAISDTTWFSPTADELAGIASRTGFTSITVDYQKILIKFMNKAALEMIRRWGTKNEFLTKYHDEIQRTGIEYPMEQILYCTK